MKRSVIKIDEELCNGCGNCVTGCHEGALQLIDGKAVMISDLFCDGLGACIGDCPVGAITLEEREAAPYDESAVMERLAPKGEKVIVAHLKHLKEFGQSGWFNEGIEWLQKNNINIDLSKLTKDEPKMACGCPGSMERDFTLSTPAAQNRGESQLRQWPVQLHLVNPAATYFQGADVVLASDCSAFAHGSFHETFLKNKSLAIACPKLDSNTISYQEKIAELFDHARINTLTVIMMEVPCCGGLMTFVERAREISHRKVPVKAITLSVRGDIIGEEWV